MKPGQALTNAEHFESLRQRSNIRVLLTTPERLTAKERHQMLCLHSAMFANVDAGLFFKDLDAKDRCIVVIDGQEIAGFSTMQCYTQSIRGQEVAVLFSGNTVIAREYWNQNLLVGAVGYGLAEQSRRFAPLPCYWLLLSKGYRTYRLLPVYFREFWPHCGRQPQPDQQLLLDEIAAKKFGDSYQPGRGIVSFNGERDYLIEELAQVPTFRRRDPHVQFFLEKNSGYTRGDELVCLAPVHQDNFNARAWRVICNSAVEDQVG